MKWFLRLEGFLDQTLKVVMTTAFSVGALLYLFQVILRIFFRSSVLWIDPLIQYLFVMAALFGAAFAVKSNENIKIELFRKWAANPWVRRVVNVTAFAVSGLILFTFIQRFGIEFEKKEISDFLVPRWVLEIPYLFLFSMTLFYYAVNVFRGTPPEPA